MLLVVQLRALTLQPKVRRQGKQLSASTSWLVQLLTLGGYRRVVHVDGDARYVYFHERSFWFWVQSRIVQFKSIARVRYDYRELPTAVDWTGRFHDTLEAFTVAFELTDSEERVPVATFFGEGAAGDVATWLLGDSLIDAEGTQEQDSRSFVSLLCELIGVGLAKPLVRVPDAQGQTWRCSACGRPVPPRPRCLYCGGAAGAEND